MISPCAAALREAAGICARRAPREGYNATPLPGVRLLRSSTRLEAVPVLYRPGAVFVLRGGKRGAMGRKVFVYDAQRYLAVAAPVAFKMESWGSPREPLLAVYADFDLTLAAELALELRGFAAGNSVADRAAPAALASSAMEPRIADTLLRLLRLLDDAADCAILGPALVRELHYRVLTGEQRGALIAALTQAGPFSAIGRCVRHMRSRYAEPISVAELASLAGMSTPTFHAHFKSIMNSTPLQFLKSVRLHEARAMIANGCAVSVAGERVGYSSASQFSREFKRFFGRTAAEEARWVRRHIGHFPEQAREDGGAA